LALGLVAGGTGIAVATNTTSASTSSTASGGHSATTLPNQRVTPNFQRATATSGATAATAAQKVGVVTIVSTLDYDENSQAAGTGTILTSSGYILTNNHVIEGSTSIEVTVESTGKSYTATVVGTDATDDVAVLKLAAASGLTAAHYASATAAAVVGDAVTAIGNAEGTGDLVSASGTVVATDQAITVQGDTTDATENLANLIETNADIVPGDSGGPLLNAAGTVIGMDTAASAGTAQTVGYAIPIANALAIAKQIESGTAGGNVVIGNPAFLGIELSSETTTALVAGLIADGPAESAGLVAGDTITAIGGTAVSTSDALRSLVSSYSPGDRVTVTWSDASGASTTATVTLAAGPAL
jgi:S1-C subfamily serine protease